MKSQYTKFWSCPSRIHREYKQGLQKFVLNVAFAIFFFGKGYVRVAYLNGANGTLLLGGFPLACVAKLSFDWIPIYI